MPQESIRVYFSMVDGASRVMATIGDQTKALDKERPPPGGGGGLDQNVMDKNQIEMRAQIADAASNLLQKILRVSHHSLTDITATSFHFSV